MNDLDLLETHGPAAAPIHANVLDRARLALLDEIANKTSPEAAPPGDRVKHPRPAAVIRRRYGVGLVAACAAGAALFIPSVLGLNSSGAIALVPSDPMLFPLTPAPVPSGLSGPIFEMDSNFMLARYGGRASDGLTVVTGVESDDFWSIPEDARTVDISGHDGTLFNGLAFNGTTTSSWTVSVVWLDANGDWTGVTGRGAYADAVRVESFADSLKARPQPVNLSLKVAPEGWSLDAYKEDRILMFSPDDGPEDVDLTVSLVDHPSEDFGSDYGVREVTTVQMHNRDAQVGESASGWVVLARTPDGQPYSVLAPEMFTRDQAVEVAEGVGYTN